MRKTTQKLQEEKQEIDQLQEQKVGLKSLATLLGVTEQHVNKLSREGICEKADRNQYKLLRSVTGYIDSLKNGGSGGESLTDEKKRLTKLQGDKVQFDLEVKQQIYVLKDDVKTAAFVTARRIRDGLLNIPDRLAGELAAQTDTHKIYTLLLNEMKVVLEGLSKSLVDLDEVISKEDEEEPTD